MAPRKALGHAGAGVLLLWSTIFPLLPALVGAGRLAGGWLGGRAGRGSGGWVADGATAPARVVLMVGGGTLLAGLVETCLDCPISAGFSLF